MTASPDDFLTVRDVWRYGVSRFSAADLAYGHGAANAMDEATFIVLESLSLPIDQPNPFMEARLTRDERALILARIEERIVTRKPAPYILGRAYMHGLSFAVNENTIVPRSYIGELLVSGRLTGGTGLIADPTAIESVLDLCTGSGCLAIMAAMAFPNARVAAVDLSPKALEVARRNVAEYGMEEQIALYEGDLFAPLKGRTFDLILTNPPYVDAEGMDTLPPEYLHEPRMALAGGSTGIDIVARILEAAPQHLNPGGGMVCEIGRCKPALEEAYPTLDFLWLDTEESEGEVFWIDRETLGLTRGNVRPRR
jgi:ribosomal protein L3 glutamine methyltransferase